MIESYTITKEHYSLADKALARLEGLFFKDSRRTDLAEFFAILSAKVSQQTSAATADKDAEIRNIHDQNTALLAEVVKCARILADKDVLLRELVEAVEGIEWGSVRTIGGSHVNACPCCYKAPNYSPDALKSIAAQGGVTVEYAETKCGHDSDCRLATALQHAREMGVL